ncbi:hypothetical protein Bbelb_251200 [Branchiostoma belcheri]|nr:hypothetical protein Bbelb_251200 [Branchiostoma belcheri]
MTQKLADMGKRLQCRVSAPMVVVLVVCALVASLCVFSTQQQRYSYLITSEGGSLQGIDRPDVLPATANISRSEHEVANPHPFVFTLNHPVRCASSDVFLLIIVPTPPEGRAQRQVVRQTWGDETSVPGVVIRTVFAVGASGDVKVQQALEDENKLFGDIIQENFADTPRNATLKTVMGLKWASRFCPNAKYVLKASPDIFVNILNLVNYLEELPASATKLLVGWVNTDEKPARDPLQQRYVPKDEYPRDMYPPYARGFAYVMSGDMPKLLYETSLTTKYFFQEDVYVGTCLKKLGIAPKHHSKFCDGFYSCTLDCYTC